MVRLSSLDVAKYFSVLEMICLSRLSSSSSAMVLLEMTLLRCSKKRSWYFFWKSASRGVVGCRSWGSFCGRNCFGIVFKVLMLFWNCRTCLALFRAVRCR